MDLLDLIGAISSLITIFEFIVIATKYLNNKTTQSSNNPEYPEIVKIIADSLAYRKYNEEVILKIGDYIRYENGLITIVPLSKKETARYRIKIFLIGVFMLCFILSLFLVPVINLPLHTVLIFLAMLYGAMSFLIISAEKAFLAKHIRVQWLLVNAMNNK